MAELIITLRECSLDCPLSILVLWTGPHLCKLESMYQVIIHTIHQIAIYVKHCTLQWRPS
jgi:hypothetical protein